MKRLIGISVFAALFLAFSSAQAGISVFLNSPVNGAGAGISAFSYGQQEADNFLLGGSYSITQARWWGAYGSAPDPALADSFTIRFFNGVPGGPGANPFAEVSADNLTRTATGMNASAWGNHDGGTVYEYYADLSTPVALGAGTTYYLSIISNSGSTWGWLEDGAGNHWYRSVNGSAWSLSGRNTDFAFELVNTVVDTVPAPGAILLSSIGVGIVSWLRRRRTL